MILDCIDSRSLTSSLLYVCVFVSHLFLMLPWVGMLFVKVAFLSSLAF